MTGMPEERGASVLRSPGWRYGALAMGAFVLSGLAYIGVEDPHRHDTLFPPCPFKMLTGWNCPFCGGLRMVHDLLHGDVAGAAVDNVFLLVGLPALAAWMLWRRRRGRHAMPLAGLVTFVVLAVGWGVIRNLPGFPLVPTLVDR